MVISNWVERKLEERRIRREDAIRAEGREEGFEQGRAYERKRIADEAKSAGLDEPPTAEIDREIDMDIREAEGM